MAALEGLEVTDGIDNGISGGNDRTDRIAKFMREAPSKATTLVLTAEDGESILATWDRSEWSDVLAQSVNLEMEAQHEQADVSDSFYWLIFTAGDGDVRATKRRRFNCRTRRMLTTGGDAPPLSHQLDGTGPAASALMQNTLYRMVALYSSNMQALLNSSATLNNTAVQLNTTLTNIVIASQKEASEARAQLNEALQMIVENGANENTGEMTEAQKAWFDLAQRATSSAELQRLVEGLGGFLKAKFTQ